MFKIGHAIRASKPYWAVLNKVMMPLLRQCHPELAHHISIKAFKHQLTPLSNTVDPEILKTTVWGLSFSNPIGIAAGFDKQAEAMGGLFAMGFGFVEIGSVTPKPQPGNAKPRLFRLPEDKAVINYFGLNSVGHEQVAARLAQYQKQPCSGIIGINIAKNTGSDNIIDDYRQGVRKLGGHADFIVLNISCPNVTGKGIMSEKNNEISDLIVAVKQERDNCFNQTHKPPLLLKVSPDMNHAMKIYMADIALSSGVDGLVVSNTSSERVPTLKSKYREKIGGLSGAPLKQVALQTLRDMYRLTDAKIPLIGVGGIASAQEAYARIRAGASLVQIYTALIYKGPGLIVDIKKELAMLLEKSGFGSVAEAVGSELN